MSFAAKEKRLELMQRRSLKPAPILIADHHLCGVAVFWLLLCDGRPWRLFARGGSTSMMFRLEPFLMDA